MSLVFEAAEIRAAVADVDVIAAMERAFSSYSSGRAVVPPVAELLFEEPPGDVHIKYGYVRGDDYYVIKIASGFYNNPTLGLASSNGLMLLFRQQTGELAATLLDEGYLTDVRTAAAGAVAARWLAPKDLRCIGIVGSGTQAGLQLRCLSTVTDCRRVLVWGRSRASLEDFCQRQQGSGFDIGITDDIAELTDSCRLIVTTTPSCEPLLHEVRPGTHITAVGSDTAQKQELSPQILARCDRLVVDSRAQAQHRGEVFQAAGSGAIDRAQVVELGEIIAGSVTGRSAEEHITVADLTGVATQDIEIAKAIYQRLAHAH